MNITAAASRLRFMAQELMDEASRHHDERRRQLSRAAQQCAACAINISNLAKRTASARELRSTAAAADAVHEAAIELLVSAAITRTPELHQEGTPA